MDKAETKSKIEETVMEILKKAEMEEMSEFKIRSLVAERLGMDLSDPECQQFVRRVIESFLLSMEEEPVAAPPPSTEENKEISSEEGNERKPSIAAKDYDECGNLVGCKPSNKREVTVQDYERKTRVSSIEYYLKDAEQFPSPKEMEPEIKRKIEKTVMEILNKAETDDTSESKVLSLASEKLGMDVSGPECQPFVRRVIESFLLSMEEEPLAEAAATEEKATKESTEEGKDEYGNAIICKLSSKRRETVQDFKGKTLLPIREYCLKYGKPLPSSKETKNKIEEMVMEILKKAKLEKMSEFKVRSVAAEKLRMDLLDPECQQFVRRIIESFFLSIEEDPVAVPTTEGKKEATEMPSFASYQAKEG